MEALLLDLRGKVKGEREAAVHMAGGEGGGGQHGTARGGRGSLAFLR